MIRLLVRIRAWFGLFARLLGLDKTAWFARIDYKLKPQAFKACHGSRPVLAGDAAGYLGADSRAYVFKTVNNEGRPGFVADFNASIVLDLPRALPTSSRLLLSFAVTEPLSYSLGLGKIAMKTSVLNSHGDVVYEGTFDVALDGGNFLYMHLCGAGWVTWSLALSELLSRGSSDEQMRLRLEPTLVASDGTTPLEAPAGSLFIGCPQVVHTKPKPRKIIAVSCESLTDPGALRSAFPEESKAIDPAVFELMERYGSPKLAYSQGDCTMPSSNAQFSGLLALQHGLGCYNPGPQTPNTPVRNESVLSVAQILKRRGYLTLGSTMYSELSADYGCGRGFDSYINVDVHANALWPNLENSVLPALEDTKGADSFHYIHLDSLLHGPFFNARGSVFSGVANLADMADRKRRVNLYIQKLNQTFWQFHMLDEYVRKHQDEADFLVLITGDHGHGLEPWWGKHGDYALYEQRVRVPFMMKDFSGRLAPLDRDAPVNASLEIFKQSLRFAEAKGPDVLSGLPQFRPEFQGVSISETLLHPKDDDYCLVLSDGRFKYATALKLDYDARKIESVSWEKLFKYSDGLPVETADVKNDNPAVWKEMKARADALVVDSLGLNARYPAMSLLEPTLPWSVNDPRSPSYTRRRAKKVVKA